MSEALRRQPFLEHVQELRGRLAWSIAALLIGTAIGYFIKDELLRLLVAPLGKTLYYTSPGGGFSLIIQICLGFGVIFAVPVFVFHLIRFLSPVLQNYSLRFLIIILISSCVLVTIGVAFAYFISLPAALYFLNEFSNDQVQALISTDTYMSFVALYLAGFAILFQLPLLLLVINSISPLQPKKLLTSSKWVVLASFIIAAIITPTPDPFNQAIMAGPIIVLYAVSIVLIKLVNRKRKIVEAVKEPQEDTSLAQTLPHINQDEPKKFDLSQIAIVKRRKAYYKQREGEFCMWKFKDGRSNDTIITFLYQGKHEFIKVHRS
jgi:sec-independent protein translocase protein TatC